MKNCGYVFFVLIIVVGFVLMSFSFSRYQQVLVSRFILGFIMSLAGIIGCLWLDYKNKAGDKNGHYLSMP